MMGHKVKCPVFQRRFELMHGDAGIIRRRAHTDGVHAPRREVARQSQVADGGILRECGHGPERKREDRQCREGAGSVPLNVKGMAIPAPTCQHVFVPCN
jgi:hypothetical protein